MIVLTCFHTYAQFQLNGNAVQLDTKCYQLTPDAEWKMGTMWNTTKVNLNNSFDIQADLNLGCDDNGADGIVFGLQQQNTSAGSAGGGLGFEGIKPSIGVEFDTYQNGGDPSYDHIAIIKNGIVYHDQVNTLTGPVQASSTNPDIEDCKSHVIRFIWNVNTKTLSVYFDCNLRLSYTGDIVNTIFSGNPDVYWGFTAATGSMKNDQRVCLNYVNFQSPLKDKEICKGDKVQLTATGGRNYSWTPSYNISGINIPNPVVSPDTTTTYIVTFQDVCGAMYKDSAKITVTENKKPSLFSAGTYCIADTADTLSASISDGVWSGKGITDTVSGIFSPSIAGAGTHIITYTLKGKCIVKNTTSVTVSTFKVSIVSAPASLCNYDKQDTLKAVPIGGIWSGKGITDSISGIFNPSIATKGTHDIIYTTSGKCGDADTVSITVNAMDATILPSPVFCSTDTNVQLTSVNSGGIWSGEGITDTFKGVFNPSLAGAGTHDITYSIQGVCNDTDTKQVTVVLPQRVYLEGNELLPCNETITIAPKEEFNNYLWNDNSTGRSLTVQTAGTYSLTVTDSNGCHSSDTIAIAGDSCLSSVLWIPNIFTPNGDGKNDTFRVGSYNITEFKALIFNRWGELIYEWNDVNGGWNGNYKGRQCPDGVYVYLIRAKGIDNALYDKAGHITLIR